MSKCDLEIALDRPDRTYRPGDKVSGFVGVTVNKDARCEAITLTREWRTHGSGNRARGGAETIRLAEGDLVAGEKQLHPFEIVVPPGPVTYHGHHLNVDWYLTARADIPWAFDPKVEEELIVVPGEAPLSHGPRHRAGPKADSPASRMVLTVVALVLSAGAAVFLFVILGAFFSGETGLGILPLLAGPGIFFGIGGFLGYLAWRNHLAERRLGEVRLEVTPATAWEGDEIEVTLGFTPRREVRLNGARLVLVVKERCVSGSGTDKRTWTHELYRDLGELAGPSVIAAGEATLWRTTLRLPRLEAPSFDASDNQLLWMVTTSLDIAGWPDWKRDHVLTVRP